MTCQHVSDEPAVSFAATSCAERGVSEIALPVQKGQLSTPNRSPLSRTGSCIPSCQRPTFNERWYLRKQVAINVSKRFSFFVEICKCIRMNSQHRVIEILHIEDFHTKCNGVHSAWPRRTERITWERERQIFIAGTTSNVTAGNVTCGFRTHL